MCGDESDDRVHDGAQPDDSTTAKIAHCCREGFVGLVDSGDVTKIAESGVAGEVSREVPPAAMTDGCVENSDGT